MTCVPIYMPQRDEDQQVFWVVELVLEPADAL